MPADPWVISLDLGTGSCKAIALDRHGRLLARSSADYPMRVDARTLTATQSLEDLWNALVRAIAELSAKRFSDASPVAMALSGAMHSLMICRRDDGRPLADAMTWADGRCYRSNPCDAPEYDPAELHRRTGCPWKYVYHPMRLAYWVRESSVRPSDPVVWCGLSEAIYHRLTGRWKIGSAMASTTGLMDIHRGTWDPIAMDMTAMDIHQWPTLVQDGTSFDALSPAAARVLGLPVGLPVSPAGADGLLAHHAGGQANPGDITVTVGSSGAIRLTSSCAKVDPSQQTWCYRSDCDRYVRGGAINNGGLALKQIIRSLAGSWPTDQALTQAIGQARRISAQCDGLMILPYFLGERTPYWNPMPQERYVGRRPIHTLGHHVRSVMQSVAFCLAQVKRSLGLDDAKVRPAKLTGGIVQSPLWCQILADVLQWELQAIEQADASAIGAAMNTIMAFGLNDPATWRRQGGGGGGGGVGEEWGQFQGRRYSPDVGQARLYRQLLARFQSESEAIMQP